MTTRTALVVGGGIVGPAIILRSYTGKLLGETRAGGVLSDGTTSQTIKRADLYRARPPAGGVRPVRGSPPNPGRGHHQVGRSHQQQRGRRAGGEGVPGRDAAADPQADRQLQGASRDLRPPHRLVVHRGAEQPWPVGTDAWQRQDLIEDERPIRFVDKSISVNILLWGAGISSQQGIDSRPASVSSSLPSFSSSSARPGSDSCSPGSSSFHIWHLSLRSAVTIRRAAVGDRA